MMKPKSLIDAQIPVVDLFVGQEPSNESSCARYKRQIDVGSAIQTLEPSEHQDLAEGKRTRDLRFAFVPKNYVRLGENDSGQKSKELKNLKRKKKYKKYKKNIGKALRYSWKCLMLGLQNLTVGYSTPLTAAATLYQEFQTGWTRS